MSAISAYTARLYTSLDGAEVWPITDSGTTYKLSLTEHAKWLRQSHTSKPVTQSTRTSIPTSLPVTAGARNLFWMNTTSGNIDVSALADIGLAPGQSVIFRKTSTDTNMLLWSGTVGGTALTSTMQIRLEMHYAKDSREIELVWDGAAYSLVSTSPAEMFGLIGDGVTDNYTALSAAITWCNTTGRPLIIPPGTYIVGSSWTRSQVTNVRVIGIGMPVLQYSGTILQDAQTTNGKNQSVFSIADGGSLWVEGVKFKNWNHAIRHESSGGTSKDAGCVKIHRCEFENCNYAYCSADGWDTDTVWNVDELRRFEFTQNYCKDMYCGGVKVEARRLYSYLIDGNEIDGISTAPWYTAYGTASHTAVAVVGRANHGLSGTSSIDGVSLTTGVTRVLLVGQTTASQNGIWIANSSTWTRAADMPAAGTFTSSDRVAVTGGTSNRYQTSSFAGAVWKQTVSTGTTGTNSQTWEMLTQGKKTGVMISEGYPYPTGSGGASGDLNLLTVGGTISNNVIKNITNVVGPLSGSTYNGAGGTGATGPDVSGIQCMGAFANVVYNHIENVNSYAYQNVQGIYTKTRWGLVHGNTLYNCGASQAAIALKGHCEGFDMWLQNTAPTLDTNAGTTGDVYGWGVTCTDNRIYASDGASVPRWGISVWTGPCMIVRDNMIEGVNLGVLVTASSNARPTQERLVIADNTIRNLVSCPSALLFNSELGTYSEYTAGIYNIASYATVSGNHIKNIICTMSAGRAFGLYIGSPGSATSRYFKNVKIINNVFDGIKGNASTCQGIGIEMQSETYGVLEDCEVRGNYFRDFKYATDTPWYAHIIRQANLWTGIWVDNIYESSTTGFGSGSAYGSMDAAGASFDATPTLMRVSGNRGNYSPKSTLTIPLSSARIGVDAIGGVLTGTASGSDLALVSGTWATADTAPLIQTSNSDNTSVTQYCRFLVPLPQDYCGATKVTLRLYAGMETTVAATSATIDAEVHEIDGSGGGTTSDICSTNPISINSTTYANCDFTLTPTSLVAGDMLDIRIKIAIVDTGVGTAVIGSLGRVQLLY